MERSIKVGKWQVTVKVERVEEPKYPVIPDGITAGGLFDPEWIEKELAKVQASRHLSAPEKLLEVQRMENTRQDYVELNNLYLAIERGSQVLTIYKKNRLCTLVGKVYGPGETTMREYWEAELQRLPRWEEI